MLVVVPVAWILFVRMEGGPPMVTPLPESAAIGLSQSIHLDVSDAKSGIKHVRLAIVKNERETVLFERRLPSAGFFKGGLEHAAAFDVSVAPGELGLTDGPAVLQLVVRDFSWRKWGRGNVTRLEKQVMIDTVAPDVDVLTHSHNVTQGGSGLAVYRLSETCRQSGVVVGDVFFPGYSGYFEDPNVFLCFFALNYQQGKGTSLVVQAVDTAGNRSRAGLPHYIRARKFKKDVLTISDRFLDWKMPEFKLPEGQRTDLTPLEKFLTVNRDLREANYRALVDVSRDTGNRVYWTGVFGRLPGSARRAAFADHREYRYKGQVADRQVHMGIDLASVKRAPVPAANAGKVVFAAPLGIYGKTVVLDHGFGLFSMYAHLSRIDVQKGQTVQKSEILGKTGRTGMAAGDHLHFGMLVHNTFVNPVEWWDAAWIKNNVIDKLDAVAGELQ